MPGTAVERLRCSCGQDMSTKQGFVYCDHCDKPCSVSTIVVGCPSCSAQARSQRPKGV